MKVQVNSILKYDEIIFFLKIDEKKDEISSKKIFQWNFGEI